jgi:hypothetical protein
MTEDPSINVDEFCHRPVNEIAAILPNKEAVSRSTATFIQMSRCMWCGRVTLC